MDYDKEIAQLAGETLALQALLTAFVIEFAKEPTLHPRISRAYDAAANFLELQAIALGNKARPDHLTHSLRVVEDLRKAALD